MHKSKLTSRPEIATDSEIIIIQKQDKFTLENNNAEMVWHTA
jgi:hypothetical protein